MVERLVQLGALSCHQDTIHSTVDLYCSGGMLFATDHRYMLKEGDALDEDPVMYIGMDSHGLVQTAPRAASGCSTSAVVPAFRVWYAVVMPQTWSRWTNHAPFDLLGSMHSSMGFDAMRFARGLYDCVKDEQFDVILGPQSGNGTQVS